ncbi:MAG TPA: DUF1844 domain-containing protein [Verrucomicrobiae bacterium]|nr:DUF1844 domain-containing protein [Verrucomicrobiae bacterium]
MNETPRVEEESSALNPDQRMSALFAQLVIQEANMAMLLLGKTPHPESGQTVRDLEGARMFIDQLEMLEAKTKGNLGKEEAQLLKQSLMSLHLAFVEAVRAEPKAAPEPAKTAPAPENPSAAAQPDSDSESKKKFSKKY